MIVLTDHNINVGMIKLCSRKEINQCPSTRIQFGLSTHQRKWNVRITVGHVNT